MPPHARYIEPFFGGGAIFYAKKPASTNVVNDVDPGTIAMHGERIQQHAPATLVACGDAVELLTSPDLAIGDGDLVYADPPYHFDTRSKRRIYRHEMDDAGHRRLLACLKALPCMVILSGYRCALYDAELADWHRQDWQTMSRGGVRTESAWCNFQPPAVPADLRYVGADYRERERIKRKRQRWVSRLLAMAPGERAVIAAALAEVGEAAAPSTVARLATSASGGGAGSRIVARSVAAPAVISGGGIP